MIKNLTCIECPKGCVLSAEIESGEVVKVSGNLCPKGLPYASSEIENPTRILTSTVLAKGLSLKMVPVRTDRAIPKPRILEAAQEIRKLKIEREVQAGEVIVPNFLGLGVNLVATRGTHILKRRVICPSSKNSGILQLKAMPRIWQSVLSSVQHLGKSWVPWWKM